MRIAFVTTYDAGEVDHWSGTGFFMARALEEQGIDLVRIGPLESKAGPLLRIRRFLHEGFSGKSYRLERAPALLDGLAEEVAARLRGAEVDAVFSPGTIPVSHLRTDLPVVFWTDACAAGMIGFYPDWSNLCEESIRDSNQMEQAALANCRLAIYSSEWAARTAIDRYRVDPTKVKVVPFGANVTTHATAEQIHELVARRSKEVCRLLFMGVEWKRKGGDIAVELMDSLKREGVNASLTVVGCEVPERFLDRMDSRGFISKKSPQGLEAIERLFKESHFLIVPSRADCVPVVIAEANAYGVPVIASDVGGISTAVRNGVNGYAFPLSEYVGRATELLGTLVRPDNGYQRLANRAFAEYEDRLNWRIAGHTVRRLLEDVVG